MCHHVYKFPVANGETKLIGICKLCGQESKPHLTFRGYDEKYTTGFGTQRTYPLSKMSLKDAV